MSIEYLKSDFEKIRYLQQLLIVHCTGGRSDDSEFQELRHLILSNPAISDKIPSWVRICRDLSSFWGFIKPKFGTYAERRTFISNEFTPVLDFLEFGQSPTATPLQSAISNVTERAESLPSRNKRNVFIVHGRDNELKQEVARYIESLGLRPIILHEQASGGRTIIEKIETYAAECDFGIILYTHCDWGKGVHETEISAKKRARQNVVFEHGYLMAKLGRQNTCALVKDVIETPNDISGVVYVAVDAAGAWKNAVRLELAACGYSV